MQLPQGKKRQIQWHGSFKSLLLGFWRFNKSYKGCKTEGKNDRARVICWVLPLFLAELKKVIVTKQPFSKKE